MAVGGGGAARLRAHAASARLCMTLRVSSMIAGWMSVKEARKSMDAKPAATKCGASDSSEGWRP